MFKCIFLNENVWIPIKILLKFVPKGSINNNPALFQIMAWRRPGDKPLSEPMMVSSPTHICVTQPQWVNEHWLSYLSFPQVWYSLHGPHAHNKILLTPSCPSWSYGNGISQPEICNVMFGSSKWFLWSSAAVRWWVGLGWREKLAGENGRMQQTFVLASMPRIVVVVFLPNKMHETHCFLVQWNQCWNYWLNHREQISMKFGSKYHNFQRRKYIWKCCLQDGGHIFSVSVC